MENQKSPIEFNKLKEKANEFYCEGKYNDAVNIYSQLLEWEPENYMVLSNRSAAYIKLEKWNEALNDAVTSTKLKPDWGKAWGRLGAALYGQDKLDEALVAYNKANELEPLEIYTTMIEQIKREKVIEETMNNPLINNLFNNLSESIFDPKIMEKLSDPVFQNKVLSFQNNPLEAIKDKEILGIMNDIFTNMSL